MTFLGRVLGLDDPTRVLRDNELWGRWARGDDVTEASLAGVRVSKESAMQLSAVWACVSLICDTISMLPLDAYRSVGSERVPFKAPPWLDQPNPDQPRHQWIGQQLLALLLDGGTAYVYTIRDARGDVLEAWNIAPERVRMRREKQRIVYDIFDPDHDLMVTVGQDQMFHIPGLSWPGKLKGISPLEAARHLVGGGLGAQEYAERFYGQGMHQSGVIEAEEDLTLEQAKELKQDFQRITGGLRKAHLPAVLVKAKWNPMTVSPEQAQFLETRAFSVNEIARFFRVPPHMIADVEKSTSWGTGIEQQGIGFVTYTLAPWLTRLEQAYSTFLLNRPFQRNAFVKFNVNGLMRGDIKTRFETYQIARQNGLMNADEIRALEDRPPLPDGAGEEYWRPANIGVVGEEQTDPGPDAAPPEGLT